MSMREFLPEQSWVMAKRKSPSPATTTAGAEALDAIRDEILFKAPGGCRDCKLCGTRTHLVIGEGNARARLVFVGEGPGEQEDLQGRPFIGRAGQLLEKMIEAMGLSRQEVYICNVVKCRPPENRNPEPDEIAACSGYLHRQLASIQPEVVVALGKFAAQTLLATEEKISSLRGRVHPFRGTKLVPTFHPAYLLRNPPAKKDAWADLQLVMKELGLPIKKG